MVRFNCIPAVWFGPGVRAISPLMIHTTAPIVSASAGVLLKPIIHFQSTKLNQLCDPFDFKGFVRLLGMKYNEEETQKQQR